MLYGINDEGEKSSKEGSGKKVPEGTEGAKGQNTG